MSKPIQRSPGSWFFRLELGTDPTTGKRKQQGVTVRGSYRDACREQTRLQREIDTGGFIDPNDKTTLAAYLDRWLRDYAKSNVRPTTYETWETLIRVHLKPCLGRVALVKLTPMMIQSFYTDRLERGRADGKGGLSPMTVKHLHRLLFQALDQAVKWQVLARNPAAAAEPPKVEREERPVLDEEGIRRLVEGARGSWLYLPICIALSTSLRRGEILALKWDRIDLKAGTLKVQEALQRTQTHGLAYALPKTKKSKRTVELPEVLVDALRRHKGLQAEIRLQMGDAWQNHGLVICQDDGTPRTPDNLTHSFLKLVRRLELPEGFTFHDLRHTSITHLIMAGEPLQAVSERAGHSSVAITLGLYGHLLPGAERKVAQAADATLRRAVGGF